MVLAAVTAARAQVVQRPQDNIVNPGSIPGSTLGVTPEVTPAIPQGSAPTSLDMPDERPLWRLLSAGDDATLEERLGRLRAAYPNWTPPAQMLTLLAQRRDERLLAQAKAAKDWAAVRRIAAQHPEMAACGRPDDAAVVAAAPGAPSTLGQALAACPTNAARVALLAAAADRFGSAVALPFLDRVDEAALPEGLRSRIAAIRADADFQRLGRALAAGSPEALSLGASLRGAIEARRDGGTATALGYAALKAGQVQDAIGWFETGRRLDPGQPPEGLARAYAAAGDAEAARRLLAQAPGPAAGALSAEIEGAQIDAAYRRGAYAEVVAQAGRLADPPIVLGWSLFRLKQFDAAAAAFERRYRAHHERAAAEGLVLSLTEAGRPDAALAAGTRLGGAVQALVAIGPAAGRSPAAGPDLGYRLAVMQLRAAAERKDAAAVARLSTVLAGPVAARRDYGAAVTLGFVAFGQDRLAEAARWFALGAQAPAGATREDAEYGAALVAFRQGDAVAAGDAAAAHPATGRWRQLRLDAAMLRAQRLSDADPDSPAAAAAAREVLRLDPTRRDAAELLAWQDVRAGRRAAAAAMFERLYRAMPDEATASGLANADLGRAQAVAAEVGGPLQDVVRTRSAQDAFDRKAFLAAARIDPGLNPALAGVGAPSFSVDTAYRSKSGGTGTSRLDAATADIDGTVTHELDRFTVRLHLVSLDAGRAATPPGAVARMTTGLPLGVEPTLAWDRQAGDRQAGERQAGAAPLLSPFGEIGLTPLGGAVGPTVQGQGGVAWQGTGFNLRVAGYRQSITESVLSFTGIVDPSTGRRFGRVTETGGKAEGYVALAPRWGVYAQASLGNRDGVDVQSNLHGAAAATLSYDVRPAGFDTLTVGPSYQFSAFQHDLSGFVPGVKGLGQGGYYSPAESHTVGAALRFQTAEARDFVVRGAVFTGWQFARSDGAALGLGGRAAASRQDGFNSVGEIVGSYRLTPRWALGGMLRYQVSPQYTDLYGGVALTLSLGDRAGVLSADLPRFDAR